MRNIKWAGIIRDMSEYQAEVPPVGAVKIEMAKTMGETMIKALPFAVPSFLIIFLSMCLKTLAAGQPVVSPLFVVIGFLLGFIGLLPHELLHAIVYPCEAEVVIGIYPKAFAAVALASFPLSRSRFIVMSLLPFVLGVLPIVLFLAFPPTITELNGLMFGMSMIGLVSPYPDLYNVYHVLRQTSPKCRLQFFGDDLYCIA